MDRPRGGRGRGGRGGGGGSFRGDRGGRGGHGGSFRGRGGRNEMMIDSQMDENAPDFFLGFREDVDPSISELAKEKLAGWAEAAGVKSLPVQPSLSCLAPSSSSFSATTSPPPLLAPAIPSHDPIATEVALPTYDPKKIKEERRQQRERRVVQGGGEEEQKPRRPRRRDDYYSSSDGEGAGGDTRPMRPKFGQNRSKFTPKPPAEVVPKEINSLSDLQKVLAAKYKPKSGQKEHESKPSKPTLPSRPITTAEASAALKHLAAPTSTYGDPQGAAPTPVAPAHDLEPQWNDDSQDDDNDQDSYYSDSDDEAGKLASAELSGIRDQLAEVPFGQQLNMMKSSSKYEARKITGTPSYASEEQKQKRMDKKERDEMMKAPAVMSSKTIPKRFQKVVVVKRKESRDPRFTSLSGDYSGELFAKRYGFAAEMIDKEVAELKRKIYEAEDEYEKRQIQKKLTKLMQHVVETKREIEAKKIKRERMKKEAVAVAQGKNPFYLKESAQKEIMLEQRYKELEGKGKLDVYLQKKRRHNAAKEHRYVPYKRRDD